MATKKPETAKPQTIASPWLTEKEAAEYCRCSLWAFRAMYLPAQNSGGRKVYHRDLLDASIQARPWQRSASVAAFATSTSGPVGAKSATLAEKWSGQRLRPFKPRKKKSSDE